VRLDKSIHLVDMDGTDTNGIHKQKHHRQHDQNTSLGHVMQTAWINASRYNCTVYLYALFQATDRQADNTDAE
jgi:hypothetical protein